MDEETELARIVHKTSRNVTVPSRGWRSITISRFRRSVGEASPVRSYESTEQSITSLSAEDGCARALCDDHDVTRKAGFPQNWRHSQISAPAQGCLDPGKCTAAPTRIRGRAASTIYDHEPWGIFRRSLNYPGARQASRGQICRVLDTTSM
jgi:hypothetical protein